MLLAVLLFSFSINAIYLVWHGFSSPNWLNYRYSFVFSFFIIVMAYDAVAHIEKIKFGQVGAVCAILAVVVMIIQKLNYVFDQDTKQDYRSMDIMQMNMRRTQPDFLMNRLVYSLGAEVKLHSGHVFSRLVIVRAQGTDAGDTYDMKVSTAYSY